MWRLRVRRIAAQNQVIKTGKSDMKTPEQIRAEVMAKAQIKADELIRESTVEQAIRSVLPVEPDFVFIYELYKCIGVVTYLLSSKAEAYELFKKFNVTPTYITRGDYTSAKCYAGDEGEKFDECLAAVKIEKHRAIFRFFIETPVGPCQIEAVLPLHLFGHYAIQDADKRLNWFYVWRPTGTSGLKHEAQQAPADSCGEYSAKPQLYSIYNLVDLEINFGV
jgi:hypothetical protein